METIEEVDQVYVLTDYGKALIDTNTMLEMAHELVDDTLRPLEPGDRLDKLVKAEEAINKAHRRVKDAIKYAKEKVECSSTESSRTATPSTGTGVSSS